MLKEEACRLVSVLLGLSEPIDNDREPLDRAFELEKADFVP